MSPPPLDLSNNANDFVKSDYIEEWLKQKNLGVSMKCFGGELKKHCVINGLLNVLNKAKKLNGKSKVVWLGIKEVRYVEEDSIDGDKTDDEN